MRIPFSFVLLVLMATQVPSQNMLGIVNSNYSGASGVMLNPSCFTNSKLNADVNIFTAGGHLQTDYAFIDKNNYNPINPFNNGFADFKSYEMYADDRIGYLNGNVRLCLPSFMMTAGKNSFGFFCNYRLESNTTNVPINIIRSLYEQNSLPGDFMKSMHSGKFDFALMAWAEMGGTFSRKIVDDNEKIWVAGLNVKILESNFGAFVNANQVDYHFPNATDMTIDNIDAKFGISNLSRKGNYGMGMDLGVSYYKKNENVMANSNPSSGFENYKYKIGFSIVDVGAVRFKNASMYEVNTYVDHSIVADNTTNQNELLNFNTTLKPAGQLSVVLPTAMSVQFDYSVNGKFYVSSVFTQNLKAMDNQLRRPSLLALSPRFESRNFEIAMPLSIYDYKIPRVGISLRYRGITVGTEKVGWLFNFTDYTGVEGYISIHYFIGQREKHNHETITPNNKRRIPHSENPKPEEVKKEKLTIGQKYGGGIIIYIDSTGEHGLIAAPSDQSTGAEWGCEGKTITGAESTEINSGENNTDSIVRNCNTQNTASGICEDMVLNGFSDWYLPSKDELDLMYKNKNVVGGLNGNTYWSSSQYKDSGTLAWNQNFGNGFQNKNHKSNKCRVRAVRAF